MSRARNIKPGFFKNDRLAECQPLARILFAGLWCEADREGRLEDRPRRLKAEYLAYDDCDIDELLDELSTRGFIIRYSVAGNAYISIVSFKKHQNPHVKEAASTIPAPCEHGASTVQASAETGTSPADSPSLIPDTPSQKEPRAHDDEKPEEPTPIGLLCRAMVMAGYPATRIQQSDPRLIALVEAGVTPDEIADVTREAVASNKANVGWIVAAINGRRRDATNPVAAKAAPPKPSSHNEFKPERRARAGPSDPPKAFGELAKSLGIVPTQEPTP